MEKNLPIKIILQRKDDLKRNHGGGSGPVFFGDYTPDIQQFVIRQFNTVFKTYRDYFTETNGMPATAVLKLKEKAVAKSYTPSNLLHNNSIIGASEIDTLYVKVTPQSLQESIEIAQEEPSKNVQANMTTISSFEPLHPEQKIAEKFMTMDDAAFSTVKDRIKLRLFDFGDDFTNARIRQYVLEKIKQYGIQTEPEQISHGTVQLYKLHVQTISDIEQIAKINGIQNIDVFSQYRLPSDVLQSIDIKSFGDKPHIDSETIIGIIDGGIGKDNTSVSNYIQSSESFIPVEYQNHAHASFIASTILYGNELNGIKEAMPRRFKLLDIAVIPNGDSSAGPVDSISEEDLMDAIEEVMKKYGGIVKLWNLSLGIPDAICDSKISTLGEFLDYIQDEYKVQIFVSSGNYANVSMRTWPPVTIPDNEDRIISPADSVRAVTVGSVALKESSDSIVKKEEPSPFSRRGPGVGYSVKPELVDYGGNCRNNLSCNGIGMIGMAPDGNLVEGIGTSYSTPRTLYKFACVYDELTDRNILLSKALLIHSARFNYRHKYDKDQHEINYYGFGMPAPDYLDILHSSPNEITMVFMQTIKKGSYLEMLNFPYPKSLMRDGKYYGEIGMTLVYNPPVDKAFGVNYCRANIDASFGPCYKDKNYKGVVPVERPASELYEENCVKEGFKWCPVKSYYRNIPNGIKAGESWKLKLELLARSGVDIPEQTFALVLTIRDIQGNDIYTEMVNDLRMQNFTAQDLQIRSQEKERVSNSGSVKR